MDTAEKLVTLGALDEDNIDYVPTNLNILSAIFQLQKLRDLKNT